MNQLADKYILEQDFDEDCLSERTQPGTKYGECTYHSLCGCFVHETFKAGYQACHYLMLEDMKKLVSLIEGLQGHTIAIAHLLFPHKDTSNLTISILNCEIALQEFKEKYGEINE